MQICEADFEELLEAAKDLRRAALRYPPNLYPELTAEQNQQNRKAIDEAAKHFSAIIGRLGLEGWQR